MKGVTPVISIILLLLITVALAGSTYLWLSRTQTGYLSRTSERITESEKQIAGKIKIVSVWNESTQICMLLRNLSEQDITYEQGDLEKLAVIIDNIPYDFDKSDLHDIDQGEVISICVCNTTSCGSRPYSYEGGSITIRVEPPFGSGDTYEYEYT